MWTVFFCICQGLVVAFGDARDRPVIRQKGKSGGLDSGAQYTFIADFITMAGCLGFYLSPGTENRVSFKLTGYNTTQGIIQFLNIV